MKLSSVYLVGLASVVAVTGVATAQAAPSVQRPALVVLIAIDQFRGDYLDRFGPQLTGGLAKFRTQSAFFPHAWQDHSMTETAPGHSTMLSGREPGRTGIITNSFGVSDENAPLIGTTGPGASPRRFNGTEFYDWLVAHDSTSRVLSVSRKDRGAILPVGRAKGQVYWYSNGRFTTSRYYRDTLPSWVQAFDDSIHLDRIAGRKWDLLLSANQYPERDSVAFENGGKDFVFPHIVPDAKTLASRLIEYPWMDSVTLAFALNGVKSMQLGRRSAMRSNQMPDLLSVSLSTTDAIGHAFGPDSREVHDHVLRVDRWLGTFMTALQREVGAGRIVMVLTADHGVTPLDPNTPRVNLEDIAQATSKSLQAAYDANFGIEFDAGLFFADVTALRARGIDVDSLSNAIVAAARGRPGVRVGFTPQTLPTATDSGAIRWRRTLGPSHGWLAAFVAEPGYLWGGPSKSADHGTPNPRSLAVPIAFMGPGIAVGRYERLARTVDIAPTLAALLGIAPAEPLDGRPLNEAFVGTRRK